MTNEFTVFWSFDNGKTLEHIGYEKLDENGNHVYKRRSMDTKELRKDWTLGMLTDNQGNAKFYRFPYIVKADDTPQKNKIYADSSIFEFRYAGSFLCIGYFYFDKLELRYKIQLIMTKTFKDLEKKDFPKQKLYFDCLIMKNFRIIGTIQEDKHLLEDGE